MTSPSPQKEMRIQFLFANFSKFSEHLVCSHTCVDLYIIFYFSTQQIEMLEDSNLQTL